ncbi:MAG: DNA methyltransferase, partial [Candidatus Micrarchaeota archaeon]
MEVREALKQIPDESIDCVITSPPYWALRDYNSEPQVWDGDPNCEHRWGDKINNPTDLTFRDGKSTTVGTQLKEEVWAKKNPTSNFCTKCNAWKGELGLEPTFDLYIKHLCDIFDEIKRILKKTGTCWVNLGDTYSASSTHASKSGSMLYDGISGDYGKRSGRTVRSEHKRFEDSGLPQKSLCQIPSRFAIEMSNRGWILRNEIIWFKPNCMPSSAKDRFTVDFEKVFFFTKSKKYYFEQQIEGNQIITRKGTTKKNSKVGAGITGRTFSSERLRSGLERDITTVGRNKRCVWEICPQPFPDAHFAVFPEKLVETPILSGCPKDVCVKCGQPREKLYERPKAPPEVFSNTTR